MEKPWTKCNDATVTTTASDKGGQFFVRNVSFRRCLKRMNHWIWFKKFTRMGPLTKEPAAPTHCLLHKKILHWQDDDMCSFPFHPKTTKITWEETTAANVCQFDLPTSFKSRSGKDKDYVSLCLLFCFQASLSSSTSHGDHIILSKFQLWLLGTYCKISNKKSPHRAPSLIKDSPWWMG